ncbi:MAG TPA: sigma factor, partial [Streptosporangiaceae bacterium]
MIGEDFPAVLAAAQQGDEGAFTVLWRDGNPALLRYLKVIAPASAEDVTAETWVTVVRGLDRFRGGEDAWRAWLFTTARRR